MSPAGAGRSLVEGLGVVTVVAALGLFLVPGAYAASLETTVSPVGGAVPVSLDTSSCVAIAEALAGLSVEATVTSMPPAGAVSVEGTLPVTWAGVVGVDDVAFRAVLVILGGVLGAGAFYVFVRVWGGRA